MRNLKKIERFVDAYNDGIVIYRDGVLYRTSKKLNQFTTKDLSPPEVMRVKLGETNGRYYRINLNGASAYEHIVIYAIHHGIEELSRHEAIDHLNNNKHDNRIENLEGVTTEENNKRLIQDKLLACQKGENNGASIHSEQDILEIRRLYSTREYKQHEIADMFDMSQGTVSQIVNRRVWTHI